MQVETNRSGAWPSIGFVLVTHSIPEQTAHLCWRLHSLFNAPPIAIHHDYGKCALDTATLPPQVKVVSDHLTTSWGSLSLVEAYLKGLRLLHAESAPDWTVNLSGADYPIASPGHILRALASTSADAFLDYRQIRKNGTEPAEARSPALSFKQPAYMAKAHERYLSFSPVHYHVRKVFGRGERAIYVSADWMTRLFTPFSPKFPLYGGDWWHIVNRRAAAVLLEDSDVARRLKRFYGSRPIPDESFCQTLLVNRPELRIENNNHRYAVWVPEAYHPKTLGFEDIPALMASDAWFARKFPFDPALYDAVDAAAAQASASPGPKNGAANRLATPGR